MGCRTKKTNVIIIIVISLIIFALMWLTTEIVVNAEPEYAAVTEMRVTCYTWTGNRCSTGCYPYEGIVAGRPEWSGWCCILYDKDMNYIGIFEFRDTGGHTTLQNGTSIDVYRDTLQGCYDWIDEYGDYLYVQIVPCKG